MTKESRITLIDFVLTLDTKPTELFTSMITLGVALCLISGSSGVYDLVTAVDIIPAMMFPYVGFILLIAALGQIFGLCVSLTGAITVSRIVRWSSSIIDGCIWFSLLVFIFDRVSPLDGIQWVYGSLLLGDVWIVMGIAYRGYRGRDSD